MKFFVDTSAWYAYFDKDDKFNLQALSLFKKRPRLITSNVIFFETCALLQRRLGKSICLKVGDFLKKSKTVEIVSILEEELDKAWEEFKSIPQAKISLVDVTNKIICERLGIVEIFAFDRDFKNLGLKVVP